MLFRVYAVFACPVCGWAFYFVLILTVCTIVVMCAVVVFLVGVVCLRFCVACDNLVCVCFCVFVFVLCY